MDFTMLVSASISLIVIIYDKNPYLFEVWKIILYLAALGRNIVDQSESKASLDFKPFKV